CYLEGQTQEEAARELGWPRGTLKSRLERGRDLLHERLALRGVTLSAALIPAVLTRQAHAAVPPLLEKTTSEAAVAYPARRFPPTASPAPLPLPSTPSPPPSSPPPRPHPPPLP